jgi:hypothetical protein
MKALPLAGASVERVEMLAGVVLRPGLVRQFEARLNHIGDIDEHGGGALLALFVDDKRETGDVFRFHRRPNGRDRHFVAHFITADRLKADRL